METKDQQLTEKDKENRVVKKELENTRSCNRRISKMLEVKFYDTVAMDC